VGEIKTYRDLVVWQKAMSLVTAVYRCAVQFPKNETYALVSQIQRAAVSIPSNIAEGYGRRSTGDYLRFLQIAMGSVFELQTQLEIALNLEYLTKERFEELYGQSREVERMLSSLITKLKD
jgi:four helix bundle protein